MMKHLLIGFLNRKRRRAGNAMIEFALGSTVLVATFGGAFEFGYTFYRYNTLVTAVNDGARYASLRPYNSTNMTPKADFTLAVQNMVVYGNPTGGTAPIAPGLTTSNVQVTPSPYTGSSGGPPASITVSISGYTIDAIFAQNTINKPQVTYPYLGIYSPY
jgi:Flp pilus assembly protein TadG